MYFNHPKYPIDKCLVRISLSRAIKIISEFYDGSSSDVEIVKRRGNLKNKLWGKDGNVMADRGLTIKKS